MFHCVLQVFLNLPVEFSDNGFWYTSKLVEAMKALNELEFVFRF